MQGTLASPVILFHRELPPLDAEFLCADAIEATSNRTQASLEPGDQLWLRHYDELIAQARLRLGQEAARNGAEYVRVFEESIHRRNDEASGETWLQGRFDYALYRRPAASVGTR